MAPSTFAGPAAEGHSAERGFFNLNSVAGPLVRGVKSRHTPRDTSVAATLGNTDLKVGILF